MAKSLQRDPQLESLLANRKRELGIGGNFGSGRRLGDELAFTHGIELGRGRSIGSEPADLPPPLRHSALPRRTLLHAPECLSCLVPAAVRSNRQEAGQPCGNQTVSSV
jgi:hypothetical protein